jgi:hypothetical protein
MYKRVSVFNITEEDKEMSDLALWAWNSHYWEESSPGYAQCKYCKRHHTSEMPITIDFPLCVKNPVIADFLIRGGNATLTF